MVEPKRHSVQFSRNISYDDPLLDTTSSLQLLVAQEETKKPSMCQKRLLGIGLFVIVFAIVLTVTIVSSPKNQMEPFKGNLSSFYECKQH